jgi:hypothetical protein
VTLPSILESLDAVGSKYEIEIKRPVLELHKVLAQFNLAGLLVS